MTRLSQSHTARSRKTSTRTANFYGADSTSNTPFLNPFEEKL
jgi:hypothetical protein